MNLNAVIDASPLIYFAKLDQLALLSRVVGPIGVTPAVINETIHAGRGRHKSDARRIQQAVTDGQLMTIALTASEESMARQLHEHTPLGKGECEVIACSHQRQLKAILHDKKARKIAVQHTIQTISPTNVLFYALLRRQISYQMFKELLDGLAILTGMNAGTLLEQQAIAEEIARRLEE